jgi:tetratricopeptide (TPR) repeat protein
MAERVGYRTLVAVAMLMAACGQPAKQAATSSGPNHYVNSQSCEPCHSTIYSTYRRTGMARSFAAPSPESITTQPFYHQASGTWFSMIQRSDGLHQRRWQNGFQGRADNVEELKVDYVMGSGNHVRTYLHRTTRGTLVELPLAWYVEKGGHWGMNPGYDADHWPSHRKIGYDCMFCHNAYPAIPAGHDDSGSEPVFAGALPEGVDCQRCHGPGQNHVTAAEAKGARIEDVRKAILNPARLPPDRRVEVCMQCHLETTSFPLPNAIRRFDRAPFSYIAGEPLAAFELFFDHAPGTGHDEKFEIVNSVYRLRKSRCFLKSNGALGCTTCHNPHDVPHGPEAATHYNKVCGQCHTGAFETLVTSRKHPAESNCVGCHMPKRRTDDVVHAIMTDHLIQRVPAVPNPLAELPERHGSSASYRGEVVGYGDADALYTAVAQLVAKSNVDAGIPRLEAEIEKSHPARAEPYIELGDAWRDRGVPEKAASAYKEALKRNAGSALISRRLADVTKDRELLRRVTEANPSDAGAWYDLGLLESDQGRQKEAVDALGKAASLDPDMADAQNSLGAVFAETGSADKAEQAFRAALRIDPFHADAYANLATLLATRGDAAQGEWYLQEAMRIRPEFGKAHLNLGVLLANRRDLRGAAEQFRKALTDPDPGIRQRAQDALTAIGPR